MRPARGSDDERDWHTGTKIRLFKECSYVAPVAVRVALVLGVWFDDEQGWHTGAKTFYI